MLTRQVYVIKNHFITVNLCLSAVHKTSRKLPPENDKFCTRKGEEDTFVALICYLVSIANIVAAFDGFITSVLSFCIKFYG